VLVESEENHEISVRLAGNVTEIKPTPTDCKRGMLPLQPTAMYWQVQNIYILIAVM
jgi:hypothetical protein